MSQTTPRALYVFFSTLPDLRTLLAGVPEGQEVLVLDGAGDGLVQLAQAVQGLSGLDAIHIVSHGSAGALHLGEAVLDSASLARHADALQTLGASLATDGDLLLYGCNVGEGEAGRQFVADLARATGADVAASDDATGLGGDWILEVLSGAVESATLDQAAYTGTLNANDHGTEGNDTLIGEGLADTIHGLGGNDFIDGEAGPDLLYGDAGADTIDGNFGND